MRLVYLFSSGFLTVSLAQEIDKVAYPFQLFNGTSLVEEVSWEYQMDAPKVMPQVNATTFEWWYFDAVSTISQNESLTILFENMGPDSLGAPYPGGPLAVQISGSFSNGTAFTMITAATDGAVVEWGNEGVRGEWKGAGSSFAGNDHREYTVSIANSNIGVYGTMTLQSLSPPRYPCDVKKRGASEQLIPNMYLANSQPDAIVEVDFNINEDTLKFSGIGYHDLSWGSAPLESSVYSWYWGHGHLGPYSLVWFDVIGRDGKEYFSSWITEVGDVISYGCKPNSALVRPWGENSRFPPARGTPAPSGYSLRYDLGQNRTFVANFTRDVNIIDNDFTKHIIGLFSGGFEGGEQYEGRAMADQFQFGEL